MAAARSSLKLPSRLGAGLGLAAAAVLSLVALVGGFHQLDLRLHDLRYRLRGPVPASDRIALVEVDDATISAFESWPLPRQTYALLIAALNEAGAQAIGFDLLFLGENPDDPTGDRLLAGVTAGQSNLVHAIAFQPEDATFGGGASAPEGDREALVRHGRPVSHQRLPLARRVSMPYDDLLRACDALGHTAVAVDHDGVVRRIPQFVRYGDWAYPSLAIRLVESAARADTTLPQFELAASGVRLHWRGRHLPVPADAEGATSIVFAGDRASFRNSHSMLRVLQWYRDGDTASIARAFRGKLVVIGTTAVGEVATDLGATPFAEAAPLVYIHANAVNAALQGRFLARPPTWVLIALLLVLGAVLGASFSVLPFAVSAGTAAAVMLLAGAADQALFVWADMDLPVFAALVLPPLSWIAVEGYRRMTTERRARERERELDVARTIQRRLLPSGPPDVAEAAVFGVNVAADAVGGDYYDWVNLGDDELAVVVGDVSGHGVPAALLMSHLRASFHAEAKAGRSPSEIVQAIHDSLARATESGRFATFFLAQVSRREPRLRYCNAGHNPPMLVRGDAFEALMPTGLPLAMMEDSAWGEAEREFRPGDTLVLHSDGVTEAPHKGEFYGDERWQALVMGLVKRSLEPEPMVQALLADVSAFAREELATDDVTIVVVRRTEGAAPGP